MPSTDRSAAAPLPRASRLAAEAIRRRWGLPPATWQVGVLRDQTVPMRDGAVLEAGV